MTTFSEGAPAPKNGLLDFCYLGNLSETLNTLKELAVHEEWEYSVKDPNRPFPILLSYLIHTFARLREEDKVLQEGKYSSFNTGLVTNNQEDIYMVFSKSKAGHQYFDGFCRLPIF